MGYALVFKWRETEREMVTGKPGRYSKLCLTWEPSEIRPDESARLMSADKKSEVLCQPLCQHPMIRNQALLFWLLQSISFAPPSLLMPSHFGNFGFEDSSNDVSLAFTRFNCLTLFRLMCLDQVIPVSMNLLDGLPAGSKVIVGCFACRKLECMTLRSLVCISEVIHSGIL